MGESHRVSLQCRRAAHIQSLARGEAEISGKGNQEEADLQWDMGGSGVSTVQEEGSQRRKAGRGQR